jgi:A/G-specific adenine glycosylase
VERGGFPTSVGTLQELAGVGPYTSAAIGAIAFNLNVAPVDGNIERVISRVFAISDDGSAAGWARDKKRITDIVQTLVPAGRSGDFAQAMMDLGASICTPKNPSCLVCPWNSHCSATEEGDVESYPAKPKRKPQPIRRGFAYVIEVGEHIALERRPPTGLLGGMLMPFSSPWSENLEGGYEDYQPMDADWLQCGEVRHVFTHFVLQWQVYKAKCDEISLPSELISRKVAKNAGLPTVGKKAVSLSFLEK